MTSNPIKDPRCLLEQETVPAMLTIVLVGSRYGLERDLTVELK